ncbi:MAG: hypothetical protein IPH86_00060 [bacterium]|nr:hypothetical protein [bacterium]
METPVPIAELSVFSMRRNAVGLPPEATWKALTLPPPLSTSTVVVHWAFVKVPSWNVTVVARAGPAIAKARLIMSPVRAEHERRCMVISPHGLTGRSAGMAGPAASVVSISEDNHMIFRQPISIEMAAIFVLCPQNLCLPCARCGYREARIA